MQTERGEELSNDFQSFLDCDPDLKPCMYFDQVTRTLRLNANKVTPSSNVIIMLSIVDIDGAVSANKVKKALLIEYLCQV